MVSLSNPEGLNPGENHTDNYLDWRHVHVFSPLEDCIKFVLRMNEFILLTTV